MTDQERLRNNSECLDKIIKDVFQIAVPKIDESRREAIRQFIDTTVNGDTAITALVISAVLDKDRRGILVYILTSARLIKIEIDTGQEIKSVGLRTDTIIGVERKLVDDDRAAVEVVFQTGSMGLRYSAKNKEIADFFQKVEQLWSKASQA